MLPNFFVIGASKAGTTSLYHYLNAHPEIHMAPMIDSPRFFAPPRDRPPLPRDAYEALFETDALVRGERAPSYSVHPLFPGVPERIEQLVPEAKFVYMVRDPLERCVAYYMQRRETRLESRSLADSMRGIEDPAHQYGCGSRYAMQVERYLERFPSSRMLVVDQAALRADRAATLREVFAFLSVDPDFRSERFNELHNLTREKRSRSGAYAHLRRSRPGAALRRLPRWARRPGARVLKRAVSGRKVERPVLEDGLRHRMRAALAPDAERLRVLTGKPFASWSV